MHSICCLAMLAARCRGWLWQAPCTCICTTAVSRGCAREVPTMNQPEYHDIDAVPQHCNMVVYQSNAPPPQAASAMHEGTWAGHRGNLASMRGLSQTAAACAAPPSAAPCARARGNCTSKRIPGSSLVPGALNAGMPFPRRPFSPRWAAPRPAPAPVQPHPHRAPSCRLCSTADVAQACVLSEKAVNSLIACMIRSGPEDLSPVGLWHC